MAEEGRKAEDEGCSRGIPVGDAGGCWTVTSQILALGCCREGTREELERVESAGG